MVTESLVIVGRKIPAGMPQGDKLQQFPGAAFGGKYKHIQTNKIKLRIKKMLIKLLTIER